MWFLTARNARLTPTARSKRATFRPQFDALEDRCLLSAGALDPTFGSGGKLVAPIVRGGSGTQQAPLVIQRDGKILVAGMTSVTNGPSVLVRYNADGTLDSTFGSQGTVGDVWVPHQSQVVQIHGLAVQSDGKIVAVSEAIYNDLEGLAVARYNTDGSMDPTFGGGNFPSGYVFTTQITIYPVGIAIDANGKINVAGSTYDGTFHLALVRYNGDGTLDTTFGPGQNGIAITPPFGLQYGDIANAMALQPSDGKILVGGYTGGNSATGSAFVVRYTSTGQLDTSFNGSGIVMGLAPPGLNFTTANGFLVQSNGAIVVGGNSWIGNSTEELTLARLTTTGQLDTTFGSSGFAVNSNMLVSYGIAQGANGDLLTAGTVGDVSNSPTMDFAVAAYLPNGTPDTSFGNGGIASADIAGGADRGRALAIQGDGKVVIAGSSYPPGSNTSSVGLARFLAPNSLSPNFAVTGFPDSTTAGAAGIFTVSAHNADGTTNISYAGTVHFTSSDPQAVLPGDYTFTVGDQGAHTFSVNLKTAGTQSLAATDTTTVGITGTQAGIVVDPATANHLSVSAPASSTAGSALIVTVKALDLYNNKATGYTGTVHFTSNDPQAVLPTDYTFSGTDQGMHTFTVTLATAGNQTITVTDQIDTSLLVTTGPITVSAGALKSFVVNVLGGNTITAGNSFLITVQAADQFGKPVSNYSEPPNIPITISLTDPMGTLPSTVALSSSGFGYFLATLKTKGGYTIIVTDAPDSITGASSPITVTPGNAVYFTVSAPPTAVTGSPINNIIVKAFDPFQNLATGYTGKVHFSSSDAKATLPTDAILTGGIGTFAVTLNTAGSETITASDAVSSSPITISGTSAAIATTGLRVTALTNTPTGFTATFDKALNPADLTIYGTGGTVQDVVLLGKNSNGSQPYPGTLIVDASKKLVTFNVSANFLVASSPGGSAALPDDTYTVTLISGLGSNGFQDVAGQGFDDGHGGHTDYIGTFTTSYQKNKTQVLGISDFARGPNASGDSGTLVQVPNDPAHGGHVGIPITIYNAVNLTSAGFTLTYNANILTVTGGISDPSNASAAFHMTSNALGTDGVHSVAVFAFTSATPQGGTQILGDITAYVPYSARGQYQVKDLLALGAISVNGGASVVAANAVDANAYFGDVNGDHHLDGLDKALIANVASTASTGFSAFTLVDPAIIGDLSGDNAVTANSTSLLSNYLLALPVAKIPALPNPPIADNLFTSPFGFDPTLSLPPMVQASSQGIVNVPVLLDHPRPEGSTGLVEAELALTYDPKVLNIAASDITLGSIPRQGAGWQLNAVVDAATGQISIQLFSQAPITTDQAGSLVNIAFHLNASDGLTDATTIHLVDSKTVLADAQAAMILSPGLNWTAVLASAWVQSLI